VKERKKVMKKYLAEFVGTLVLVLFGCGTAVVLGCSGATVNAAYIGTALAFGLSIVAMAYSIGNVSGCHVNPAVSLGVLLTGGMTFGDFIGYVIAQFAGATAGAALLGYLCGWDCGFGTNALYQGDVVKTFAVEAVLTATFVLTILGVTSKSGHNRFAGLAIGLTLTLVHLFGIHFTGTSVNPARSFGPAFFAGGAAMECLWVFIAAPLAGAVIAALIWKAIEPEVTE
jgi:aquaporin Z